MAQCKAKCKGTGEQCRRKAVTGYTVCTVHGAGSRKRVEQGLRKAPGRPIESGLYSKVFKKEVLEQIQLFQSDDPDLSTLEFELAHLRSLVARVEALREDGDEQGAEISKVDKIVLLNKILDSVFKNMDNREKIKEARRYSMGVDKVRQLMKMTFTAVQKHVKDPETLKKIADDLRELSTVTGNLGDGKS